VPVVTALVAHCLQDTSRNFLCGAVADRKKYELFMEATCLAEMQVSGGHQHKHTLAAHPCVPARCSLGMLDYGAAFM
jgi:hypothetical protein